MSALWHTFVWLIDKPLAMPKGWVTHTFLGVSSILISPVGYSDILQILVPPDLRFSLAENRMQSIILTTVIQWISGRDGLSFSPRLAEIRLGRAFRSKA